MTNNAYRRQARAVSCCAGLLLLATCLPAYAQLGQSELISPGAPDPETSAIGGQPQMQMQQPQMQPQMQAQPNFSQGLTPGRGWTPPKRFGTAQSPQMAPMQQQPQQQMQGGGEDFPDNGGGMGWADTPKRTSGAYGQSELINPNAQPSAGSAFQGGQAPQQDWALPSAQSGEQWQQGMQQNMQQQMQQQAPRQVAKPPVQKQASQPQRLDTTHYPPARPMPQQAANGQHQQQMSGHVSQNGSFPTSQFNPNLGGGMGMPMNGGMQQGMNMAMPINGMQQGMGGGGMQQGMNMAMPIQQQQGMGGGGMQQGMNMAMPIQQQQGMGGGMGGGMGALGALMGGGMGGGSPFDTLGKAIKGAAEMGLIPSGSSNVQGTPNGPSNYDPNTGMYGTGSGGMGGMGGGMNSGMGGGTYSSGGGVSQGRVSQASMGQRVSKTVNNVPGVKTGKQIGRSVNRGITRNIPRAIDAAAQRGIMRALWGF